MIKKNEWSADPRLPDAFYLMRHFSHGFKNPRLFAHRAPRLSDAFPLLRGIVFLKSIIERTYEKDAVE